MAQSREVLRQEVSRYQSRCWAPTTSRTYKAHRKAYMTFCNQYQLDPVPASSDQLCMYAAFLARRLSYSSIKQYLNIVRIMHLQCRLQDPLQDFWLHCTLKGIRRTLGDSPSRKIPITPNHLKHLLSKLQINDCRDAAIYAASLSMFFGLLRRANVIPPPEMAFDPSLHLRRRDITFSTAGARILLRWSKTNQFRNRTVTLPLPRIPGHTLCPSQALYHYISLTPGAPQDGPAFVIPRPDGTYQPLSAQGFVLTIKNALSDICDPRTVGGHSLRRGGASFLRSCGVDIDLIRQLGDWASDAYVKYVVSDSQAVARTLQAAAMCLPPPH